MPVTDTLIVGTSEAFARRLTEALSARGARSLRAGSFEEARSHLAGRRFRLVLANMEPGAAEFAAWASAGAHCSLLIGFGFAADGEVPPGFDDIMPHPWHPLQLDACVGTLLRLATMAGEAEARAATVRRFTVPEAGAAADSLDFEPEAVYEPPVRVLLCADPEIGKALSVPYDHVASPTEAHAALFRASYDALVVAPPVEPVLRFARSVRRSSSLFNLPILLIGCGASDDAAFAAGVTDVVDAGSLAFQLSAHVASARRLAALRKRMSDACQGHGATTIQDNVTGLYSRGFTIEHLDRLIGHAQAGAPLSIGSLTLTSLSSVNAAHGYGAGDHLLRQFGMTVRRCLRGEDLAGRMSGADFLMLFPDTPVARARIAMARLDSVVRRTAFVLPDGSHAPVSTRLGVADWAGETNAAELIARSRERLIAVA